MHIESKAAAASLSVMAVVCLAMTGVNAAVDASACQIGTSARAVQPGEVIRVDVTCRPDTAVPRVRTPQGDVELSRVPAAADRDAVRWQALIGLDLDAVPGVYPLAVYDLDRHATLGLLNLDVAAKPYATRRLRVPPLFVEPDATDLERIARDARGLEALFSLITPQRWHGPFLAPVAAPPTSNFGTRSIFNGQPRAPHAGVDFRSASGTPVVAPGAGRIVLAEELFFTGRTIVIDHGVGLFSVLAHLSAVAVSRDDVVERGALVGRVGATGRVTGPHLHWSVRLKGARIDPLSLLFATQDASSHVSR